HVGHVHHADRPRTAHGRATGRRTFAHPTARGRGSRRRPHRGALPQGHGRRGDARRRQGRFHGPAAPCDGQRPRQGPAHRRGGYHGPGRRGGRRPNGRPGHRGDRRRPTVGQAVGRGPDRRGRRARGRGGGG